MNAQQGAQADAVKRRRPSGLVRARRGLALRSTTKQQVLTEIKVWC